MSNIRQLDERTLIASQIAPSEVAGLAASGVTLIVNNRPDGEDPDQPLAAEIEKAAEAAGVSYRHIPISRGMGPSDVDSMREAISAVGHGKMLAFCRSGNRSALVWAVARAEDGVPAEELQRCAEGAGIDLAPVAHLL
jgi:uncharacterized protein (TIGR01244 family)